MNYNELTTFEILQICTMLIVQIGLVALVNTLRRIEDKINKFNSEK